jgi:hypothetical protein
MPAAASCQTSFITCLEVVGEGGRTRGESSLRDLLLDRPDDGRVDVRADGLSSETVGHRVDGNWNSVGSGVGVGSLYGGALHRRPGVLKHANFVALAAVTADVAASKRNQN